MKRAIILACAVLSMACTQPPREDHNAKGVTCPALPALPKTPTYASQLLLIEMYTLCATLRANEK